MDDEIIANGVYEDVIEGENTAQSKYREECIVDYREYDIARGGLFDHTGRALVIFLSHILIFTITFNI